MARQVRARRRRTDGRRLEFRREHLRLQQRSHYVITNGGDQPNVVPPNASGLVLLPRNRLRAHQGAVGHRQQDGEGRGDDDRHHCRCTSSARPGPGHINQTIAETMQRTSRRSACRSGPKPTSARQGVAERAEGPEVGHGDQAAAAARPRAEPDDENRGGGSDDIGDISWNVPTVTLRYPSNIPAWPRPQLGERHRHGDADRAQGRRGRRQGRRDDGARLPDEAGARDRRGTTSTTCRRRTRSTRRSSSGRQAGDLAQREDHGEVPAGDEEVLLRPDEVQDLPRTAGHQVPDGQTSGFLTARKI